MCLDADRHKFTFCQPRRGQRSPLLFWNRINPKQIVIIGAGLMGASTAYQLIPSWPVRADMERTGDGAGTWERENLPTGSSAGESRITRKTSFENAEVIPAMTVRSNAALYETGRGGTVPGPSSWGTTRATSTRRSRRRPVRHVSHAPVADLAKSVSYVNTEGLTWVGGGPDGRFGRWRRASSIRVWRFAEVARECGGERSGRDVRFENPGAVPRPSGVTARSNSRWARRRDAACGQGDCRGRGVE